VPSTVTNRPDQSATAFPKKAPQCVLGFDRLYKTIQQSRTAPETMLSE